MMTYSFQELMLSVTLTIYVTVNVVVGVIRWGHKCAPYTKHADYYFPGWRSMVGCSLSYLLLSPVIFLPSDPDAILMLRMMLLLSSPFFCAVLIFSYFGRVLKVNWWRKPIYVLSITYAVMAAIALQMTIKPGTQMEGSFLKWYFIIGGTLALIYFAIFILAFRLILKALRHFSEENYSNPDDFPKQYAESIAWIPVLHLIMSWSTTINGDLWGLSFGLFILSILSVIILLGALSPHRATEVDRLEADLNAEVAEKSMETETLSPERKDEILRAIRHRVEDEKAYLDSNLTLSLLSRDCGLNRTYVSNVLNESLGGFFYYVNRCRLAHADNYKASHPQADVDDIALASGFNSRQSLYNARKRLK